MSGKLKQILSSPSSSGYGVSSPQQRPWLWQKLVARVERCRGRPSCVLGGCSVLEKLSNILSSVEYSVGDWSHAHGRNLACEVSEGSESLKDSPEVTGVVLCVSNQ